MTYGYTRITTGASELMEQCAQIAATTECKV